MDIMHFLTETDFGRCVFTTLVSMIPIIELRGGIPFGVALGLPYQEAFVSAVIGNIIPAPLYHRLYPQDLYDDAPVYAQAQRRGG